MSRGFFTVYSSKERHALAGAAYSHVRPERCGHGTTAYLSERVILLCFLLILFQ